MYKVIKYFTDLQDDGYAYKTGDSFPRKGKKVTEDRILQLAGKDNPRGVPLIEKVEDTDKNPNPATPAQPKKVEREAPLTKDSKAEEAEKPKKSRKKKEEE